MDHRSISRRDVIRVLLGSMATVGLGPVAASEKPVFRVGAFVSSLVGASMRDTQIGLSLMLDEVADELGWKIDVTLYDDTKRFFDDVDGGRVDLVVGSPSQLLKVFDESGSDGFYTFQLAGKPTRSFSVVVDRQTDLSDLASLAGRRIVLPVGTDIGGVYVQTELRRLNLPDMEDHFSDVVYVASYEDAVNRVFFGQADAALVTKTAHSVAAELNPQILKLTRPIAHSPEFITAMTFPVSYREEQMTEFESMMLTMHERPRGRSLLKIFGCDFLTRGDVGELRSVRDLLRDYHSKGVGV